METLLILIKHYQKDNCNMNRMIQGHLAAGKNQWFYLHVHYYCLNSVFVCSINMFTSLPCHTMSLLTTETMQLSGPRASHPKICLNGTLIFFFN